MTLRHARGFSYLRLLRTVRTRLVSRGVCYKESKRSILLGLLHFFLIYQFSSFATCISRDLDSADGMEVSAIDEIVIKQLQFEQRRQQMQKSSRPNEKENLTRPSKETSCWSLCECDPGWDENSGLSQDEEVAHEFL